MAGIEIGYHEWGQLSDRSVLLSKISQLCDVKTFFYNASDKTIKYVTFYYSAINAVGDIIATVSRKFTGPLEPDKKTIAHFEDVFNNYSSIEEVAIEKVEIEYMDGTAETIAREDLVQTRDHNSVYYKKYGKEEEEREKRNQERKREAEAKRIAEQAKRAKKTKIIYGIIGVIVVAIMIFGVIVPSLG
ncbi:MAG: hypothetical protein E7657_06065 [Ruminococcaceae bacterium]|nr:hypothetical protein [Oscillospiraceae bacterium]